MSARSRMVVATTSVSTRKESTDAHVEKDTHSNWTGKHALVRTKKYFEC